MREGECIVRPCNDGLFIASSTPVAGRVDERYDGIVREGGVERTILYFDLPTFELLKEWYRA